MGREVTARTDEIHVPQAADTSRGVHLSQSASEVTVLIKDSKGQVVKSMNLGPRSAGNVEFKWDGKNEDGALVPDGEYQVSVEAQSESGADVEAYATITGRVAKVRFVDGKR